MCGGAITSIGVYGGCISIYLRVLQGILGWRMMLVWNKRRGCDRSSLRCRDKAMMLLTALVVFIMRRWQVCSLHTKYDQKPSCCPFKCVTKLGKHRVQKLAAFASSRIGKRNAECRNSTTYDIFLMRPKLSQYCNRLRWPQKRKTC
jgi:hypothetical protein